MAFDHNPLILKDFEPIPGRVAATFLAVLAGLTAISAALFMAFRPEIGPLVLMGGLYGLVLVALLVAVRPLGPSALPALAIRGASWRTVILGPIATVALSVAVSQIGPEVEGMRQMAELVRGPGAVAGSLIVLALLAPLVEELVFRGLLYGWIEGRWGARPAIAVSAAAFAIAHFEPTYMLLVLPLGLLFSWLRWRTNSLLPSFAAHVVNNGFAVLSVIAASAGGS